MIYNKQHRLIASVLAAVLLLLGMLAASGFCDTAALRARRVSSAGRDSPPASGGQTYKLDYQDSLDIPKNSVIQSVYNNRRQGPLTGFSPAFVLFSAGICPLILRLKLLSLPLSRSLLQILMYLHGQDGMK